MMKKLLALLLSTVVVASSLSAMSVSAAGNKVFVDQDFTKLRSGFVSKYGGAEAIGAYEEDHMRFGLNGNEILSNGDGYRVGYVTYKIEADSGEEISDLTLELIGRIAAYPAEGRTVEEWKQTNWLKIYVFKDSYAYDREKWTDFEDKVAYQPEAEECGTVDNKYTYDLSKWAKGAKTVYVTLATYLECDPSWIGFSHLTLMGSTKAAGGAVETPTTVPVTPETTAAPTTAPETTTEAPESGVTSNTSTSAASVSMTEPTDTIGTGSQDSQEKAGFPVWAIILIVIAVCGGGGAAVYFYLKKKRPPMSDS